MCVPGTRFRARRGDLSRRRAQVAGRAAGEAPCRTYYAAMRPDEGSRQAVIAGYVRTPIGRYGGVLASVRQGHLVHDLASGEDGVAALRVALAALQHARTPRAAAATAR